MVHEIQYSILLKDRHTHRHEQKTLFSIFIHWWLTVIRLDRAAFACLLCELCKRLMCIFQNRAQLHMLSRLLSLTKRKWDETDSRFYKKTNAGEFKKKFFLLRAQWNSTFKNVNFPSDDCGTILSVTWHTVFFFFFFFCRTSKVQGEIFGCRFCSSRVGTCEPGYTLWEHTVP